jgi:HNH endonuclease
MYTLVKGQIPKDRVVCHTCDNTGCINPDHLWLGTHKENMADCRAKDRYYYANLTHCKRGHEFTPENTGHFIPGTELRACKTCQRGRLRIKAGWPEELAYSLPITPRGKRPFGKSWKVTRSTVDVAK